MKNEMRTEPYPRSPFRAIRAIDYTVIFVRDMIAMRRFYEDVLALSLLRELSPNWIEYGLGSNTLVLARPSRTATDAPVPAGTAALQLAFKVSRRRSINVPTSSCAAASRCCRRRQISPSDIAPCSSAILTAICWKSMRRSEWEALKVPSDTRDLSTLR